MRRDVAQPVTVLACAISAGVHAGLDPAHLRESVPLALAFIVAATLLCIVGTLTALRPDNRAAFGAAMVVFAGLLTGYAATRTTGLLWLDPVPERLDPVGAVTQAIEAAGFLAAWLVVRTPTATATRPVAAVRVEPLRHPRKAIT